MENKPMKKSRKALAACIAALQLLVAAVPVGAATVSEGSIAGVSNADPGFTYGNKSTDYIAGQDYYYLENQPDPCTISTGSH